LLHYQSCLVWF